jgi:hypothetical protein
MGSRLDESTRRQIGGLFEIEDLRPQALAGFAERRRTAPSWQRAKPAQDTGFADYTPGVPASLSPGQISVDNPDPRTDCPPTMAMRSATARPARQNGYRVRLRQIPTNQVRICRDRQRQSCQWPSPRCFTADLSQSSCCAFRAVSGYRNARQDRHGAPFRQGTARSGLGCRCGSEGALPHCQLKRPWYARRLGGAAARVGKLFCSPIMLLA